MDLLLDVRNVIVRKEEEKFKEAFNLEEKLMELLTYFEFVDLLGFAKMMEVDPGIVKKVVLSSAAMSKSNKEDWKDLVCGIVENFSSKNRKTKREFLKLAKQIKENNLEFKDQK